MCKHLIVIGTLIDGSVIVQVDEENSIVNSNELYLIQGDSCIYKDSFEDKYPERYVLFDKNGTYVSVYKYIKLPKDVQGVHIWEKNA